MKTGTLGASLVAGGGAVAASLCCLLPLAVIVLGLGSGAFMAVTVEQLIGAVNGSGFRASVKRRDP
jgi:hypothetical protein